MKDLYDKQEEARINKAIEEMKAEMGEGFSLQKLNLSELERRCGVSRARLRRLKGNGFVFKPHGSVARHVLPPSVPFYIQLFSLVSENFLAAFRFARADVPLP